MRSPSRVSRQRGRTVTRNAAPTEVTDSLKDCGLFDPNKSPGLGEPAGRPPHTSAQSVGIRLHIAVLNQPNCKWWEVRSQWVVFQASVSLVYPADRSRTGDPSPISGLRSPDSSQTARAGPRRVCRADVGDCDSGPNHQSARGIPHNAQNAAGICRSLLVCGHRVAQRRDDARRPERRRFGYNSLHYLK